MAALDRSAQLRVIRDLEDKRALLMKRLGLVPTEPETAVGWSNGRAIVVDDLHDNNIMITDSGVPYIIDSASRQLTPQEMDLPRGRTALELAKHFLPAERKSAPTPARTNPG